MKVYLRKELGLLSTWEWFMVYLWRIKTHILRKKGEKKRKKKETKKEKEPLKNGNSYLEKQ